MMPEFGFTELRFECFPLKHAASRRENENRLEDFVDQFTATGAYENTSKLEYLQTIVVDELCQPRNSRAIDKPISGP